MCKGGDYFTPNKHFAIKYFNSLFQAESTSLFDVYKDNKSNLSSIYSGCAFK